MDVPLLSAGAALSLGSTNDCVFALFVGRNSRGPPLDGRYGMRGVCVDCVRELGAGSTGGNSFGTVVLKHVSSRIGSGHVPGKVVRRVVVWCPRGVALGFASTGDEFLLVARQATGTRDV